MRRRKEFWRQVVSVCVVLLAVASAEGRTFFVDFDGGRDSADGLSARSAFKHSPGEYSLQVAIVEQDSKQPIVKLAIDGRLDDGWYPVSKVTVR